MFRKVLNSLETAGVRKSFRKGEMRCPECGADAEYLPTSLDEVMECAACGVKTSQSEWMPENGAIKGKADQMPQKTKIKREVKGDGGVVWQIPPSGKFGCLFFFAIVWLLLTALVSGGFLFAFLRGKEIEGNMPDWVLIPFFAVFWAVGFGFLYAGLREKYMRHEVSVGGGMVTLRKQMFDKVSEKALLAASISSVSQKEFYQQNYQPVYGIEIRGADGKLRFGSVLSADEKAWLVADLNRVLISGSEAKTSSGASVMKGGLAPMLLGQRKSVFSIAIPSAGKNALIGGAVFTAFGIGFICIGLYVIEAVPIPEGGGGLFDWFHFLFDNGFRTIWILISSSFTVIGLGVTVSALRGRGKDRRIEGNEAEVSIRTYRNGLVMEDRSFPRVQVTDIRASKVGSTNNQAIKRVELIVGDKVEKVADWLDEDLADKLVAEVRSAMGW